MSAFSLFCPENSFFNSYCILNFLLKEFLSRFISFCFCFTKSYKFNTFSAVDTYYYNSTLYKIQYKISLLQILKTRVESTEMEKQLFQYVFQVAHAVLQNTEFLPIFKVKCRQSSFYSVFHVIQAVVSVARQVIQFPQPLPGLIQHQQWNILTHCFH